MKNILAKLSLISLVLMSFTSVAFAAVGDTVGGVTSAEVGSTTKNIIGVINTFATPVGAFLIFIAVLVIGFSIIKNRDNAEERGKAMESLLWLAVGAFVVGGALTIAGVLVSPVAGNTDQKGTINTGESSTN